MGIKQYWEKVYFIQLFLMTFYVIRQEITWIVRDYYLQIIPSQGKQVGNPKRETEKIFVRGILSLEHASLASFSLAVPSPERMFIGMMLAWLAVLVQIKFKFLKKSSWPINAEYTLSWSRSCLFRMSVYHPTLQCMMALSPSRSLNPVGHWIHVHLVHCRL